MTRKSFFQPRIDETNVKPQNILTEMEVEERKSFKIVKSYLEYILGRYVEEREPKTFRVWGKMYQHNKTLL